MLVKDLKEELIEVLVDLDYYKVDSLEDFKKLSNIYQNVYQLDNIEINFAFEKDGDSNTLEVIAFKNEDDGTRLICRCYEQYSDIIMMLKDDEFDLRVFVKYIIERIFKSFEINN